MGFEHDLSARLPAPPQPSIEARELAIAKALDSFGTKQNSARPQGWESDERLKERTDPWRSPMMPLPRAAFAAAIVLLIAAPAAWIGYETLSQRQLGEAQPQPAEAPAAALPPAPSVAQAPPPAPSAAPARPAPQARDAHAKRQLADEPRSSGPLTRSFETADAPAPPEPVGRDRFAGASENGFRPVRDAPVSTFSLAVDRASYAFVRASLNRNVLPQPAAVRTEELVNYFPYAYEAPSSATEAFRTTVAVFPNPWAEGRKLVRIGIKGYAVQAATRPRANLVFLIDTSGSMDAPNRLPLVKQSLAMLLTQLDANDRVAIVTYAGQAGTVLEPTAAAEKAKILGALERLDASGSTAGAEGIRQAYALAEQNFDPNGVNRVILATDGDFNVGITDTNELKGFIERQRGKGIFLSVPPNRTV